MRHTVTLEGGQEVEARMTTDGFRILSPARLAGKFLVLTPRGYKVS